MPALTEKASNIMLTWNLKRLQRLDIPQNLFMKRLDYSGLSVRGDAVIAGGTILLAKPIFDLYEGKKITNCLPPFLSISFTCSN